MRMRRSLSLVAALAAAMAACIAAPPPASARPADCALYANIFTNSNGLQGRAEVICPNREDYRVEVYLRRMDGWRNTPVAFAGKDLIEQGWQILSAYEPCSDVQTDKQYFAHAYLYDGRFGPPIEIRDVKSNTVWGHC